MYWPNAIAICIFYRVARQPWMAWTIMELVGQCPRKDGTAPSLTMYKM